ncbi:MAG: sugar phosphate isomerase/epimerase [Clostridia bacterium]|nr:sugar phosphate isomerase/epimerase [Clostridia bacterium]
MIKTGIRSEEIFDIEEYILELQRIKGLNYDCVDYRGFISPNSPLYNLQDKEFANYFIKVKSVADNLGLEINQMHGVWPHDDSTAESRKQVEDCHKKAITAAKLLCCKYFVIHPAMPYGWNAQNDQIMAYKITKERILNILPHAKQNGVTICIENMPFADKKHSYSNITEIKNRVNEISDPNFKVCLDTGHCHVTGEDLYYAIKIIGNDLKVLHVHDSKANQDLHLIPYTGVLNWEGFIKGLKEINFNGCLSLETSSFANLSKPIRTQLDLLNYNVAKHLASQIENP